MNLRGKIDYESWLGPLAAIINKHFPRPDFFAFTRGSISLEVLRPPLLELQSNAFAHYADAIDGVNDGVRLFIQQVSTFDTYGHSQVPSEIPGWFCFYWQINVGIFEDFTYLS